MTTLHTVEQVREILDKLTAIKSGGNNKKKRAVDDILRKHGAGGRYPAPLPEGVVARAGDLEPKYYDKVFKAAEAVAQIELAIALEAKTREALAEYNAIGKQISSLVDNINREEDAAVAAWNQHSGESTTFREELAKKLAEAEPVCKAARMTVKDLKREFIGDRLGETQFKQILRVARGAITFQEIKKETAERQRVYRAAKGRDKAPVTTTVHTTNGGKLDTSEFGAKAQEQLAKAMAGNAVDAETSAQARIVENELADAFGMKAAGETDDTAKTRQELGLTPPDASWFYDSSPEVAATRACHELVKRGLTPSGLFDIFCKTIMLQQMNKLTRLEAGKLAGKISRQDTEAEKKAA